MWLDLLPPEICERIAAHVSRGTQRASALSLAEASVKMRTAVMSALGHKLLLFSETEDDLTGRWLQFAPYVKSLEFGAVIYDTARSAVKVSNGKKMCVSTWDDGLLRKSNCLESVDFWLQPSILRALTGLRSLRKLTIKSADSHHGDLLFQVLTSLDIRDLMFRCEARDIDLCLLSNKKYFNDAYNALAKSCPNLETLDIFCVCTGWGNQTAQMSTSAHRVFDIFPACKSLRYLKLHSHPPQNVMQNICAIHSVELPHDERTHQLAMKLGNAVTVLSCNRYLDPKEVECLSICHRLVVLDIRIKEGTENVLPKLAQGLPYLRCLKLQMKMSCDARNRPFLFPRTKPGGMLQTVRSAHHLDTLHIVDIRISTSELEAILAHCGVRLRDFLISISDQDEPALQRLETLLCTAALHNSELRSLITVLRTWMPTNLGGLAWQAHRIYAALHFLESRAPYLDASPLKRLLRIHGLDRAHLDGRKS